MKKMILLSLLAVSASQLFGAESSSSQADPKERQALKDKLLKEYNGGVTSNVKPEDKDLHDNLMEILEFGATGSQLDDPRFSTTDAMGHTTFEIPPKVFLKNLQDIIAKIKTLGKTHILDQYNESYSPLGFINARLLDDELQWKKTGIKPTDWIKAHKLLHEAGAQFSYDGSSHGSEINAPIVKWHSK